MNIVTTVMATEVQTRIDALTVPTAANIILKTAIEASDLALNITNLELVLNAAIAAITSSTSDADIVALRASAIALTPKNPSTRVIASGSTSFGYGIGTTAVTIPACKFSEGKAWVINQGGSGASQSSSSGSHSTLAALELVSDTQLNVISPNQDTYSGATGQVLGMVYWSVLESN